MVRGTFICRPSRYMFIDVDRLGTCLLIVYNVQEKKMKEERAEFILTK